MLDAQSVLPAAVLSTVVDGLLHGFKHEALNRDGEIITLRKYCPKTTLEFLKRHCGWGQDVEEAASNTKKVSLIGPDGEEMDLLTLLARGVAERDGIEIDPPRVVEAEPHE